MITFEIFYNDLNATAQKRFKANGFWHEDINLSPIAIVDMEEDEDDSLDELTKSINNEY